ETVEEASHEARRAAEAMLAVVEHIHKIPPPPLGRGGPAAGRPPTPEIARLFLGSRTPPSGPPPSEIRRRYFVDVLLAEDGDPPPPSDVAADYSGQLRLRLPRSLHERLAREADIEGVSLNQWMVSLLAERMSRRPRRSSGLNVRRRGPGNAR